MEFINYIILIGTLVSAVTVIVTALKKMLNKLFEPVNDKLTKMDIQECRKWLVDFLCDVENGEKKDEVQYQLAHEIYDRYTKELKQNSYIHDKWVRVMCKGGDKK